MILKYLIKFAYLILFFIEHDLNSDYVLDKCDAPCSTKLHCGDICSGTCGKCKQGRLHMPCKEKCNKINPCNHTYANFFFNE